jgi:hypothetical protein
MAKNVLVMIHGMTVSDTPTSYAAQYKRLYEALCEERPAIRDACPAPIVVEYEHTEPDQADLPSIALRRDQRMTLAKASIHKWVGIDGVHPSELEHLTSLFPNPVRAIESLLTNVVKDKIEMLGFTDVLYYASRDGEDAVRAAAYTQVLREMDGAKDDPDVRLHVVAHSLGATVAHDFLYGLFQPDPGYQPGYLKIRDVALEKPSDEDHERFKYWRGRALNGGLSLGSFSAAASQLPLTVVRSQDVVDRLAAGTKLDPSVIGVREDKVRWRIFFDQVDMLGFPTRGLYEPADGIEEFEVKNGNDIATIHSLYWNNPAVLESVAELIADNLG